ncbi:MAG: VWA domain-containing protein [Candidatus Solibacter usitatus]|nr:VWA domain-containing protein [Candidatus Solibacter usitatus]
MGPVSRRTLIASLGGLPLLAQDPVFRVDVKLVRMLVTVKNQMGQLAGGLSKSDFSITDNGVEQELALFERNTAQPLSVALMVDTSRSTERESRYEIDACHKFLSTLLHDGNTQDAAALYSFNWEVRLQTGFTRNLGRLSGGLARLKSEGATALYDAIFLAADEMEHRDGRRVVVVVSDGGDTISSTSFQKALEMLHRANAVMYAVLTVPVKGDAGRNLRGENALTTFTNWTGGKIFFPSESAELRESFQQILKDLRTQYLLGYYPKNLPATKDPFHKVRVAVNKPGYSVSARNGYFAAPTP